MIWPWLFAVLFVIFARKSIYRLSTDFIEYFFDTLFFAFFSAIAFGIGCGFALLIGLTLPKQWIGPESVQLASLRGNDSVNGHFFLGTGSIGTEQYYFFYEEAGQGYRPGKIKVADNVAIFEEKRLNGEARWYTYRFTNPSFKWIALHTTQYRYEFIIPEGSLKKNFTL